MIVGLKLLRADGTSINDKYGRVSYPVDEWVTVPGNGAYVSVAHGEDIRSGGDGPLLAAFECEDPTGSSAPDGVVCYRRVRRLSSGVPSAPALAEYARVCAAALAEYARVIDPAWAEYERVRATAWAECERVCAAACAEHARVSDPAWAECERVRATAWAECERVRATACAEYARVSDPAWAALIETVAARKAAGRESRQ